MTVQSRTNSKRAKRLFWLPSSHLREPILRHILRILIVAVSVQFLAMRAEARARTFCIAFQSVPAFRQGKLQASSIAYLKVNEAHYRVVGILGRSYSEVYLAETTNGRRVVIKIMKIPAASAGLAKTLFLHAIESLYLENARVAFYRESGYPTPKILDMQYTSGEFTVVKAYVEGLTYLELSRGEGPSPTGATREDLISDGQKRMTMLKDMVTDPILGFWPWLEGHRRDFEAKFPAMAQLRQIIDDNPEAAITEELSTASAESEVRAFNMLLRKSGRWVLYDP